MTASHYDALSVTAAATPKEIRKSYKRLALAHHPDRNPDPAAVAVLKTLNEAYRVLSDVELRKGYDEQLAEAERRRNEPPPPPPPPDPRSVWEADAPFWPPSTFWSPSPPVAAAHALRTPEVESYFDRLGLVPSADVRVRTRLSLREAAFGVHKEVPFAHAITCTSCSATGFTGRERCRACHGSGATYQQVYFGPPVFAPCPRCFGSGECGLACRACSGRGQKEQTFSAWVHFPPGIRSGHTLKVAGQGMPGVRPGDLYVEVDLAPDPAFEFQGELLTTRRAISAALAKIGGVISIATLGPGPGPTPDGQTAWLMPYLLPPGARNGERLYLAGEGFPRLAGNGRDDLVVCLYVEEEAREATGAVSGSL